MTKLWYLSTNKLFKELSGNDKEMLAQKLSPLTFKKGKLIYCTGEIADTIYLLKEGKIKIIRSFENGKELTVDMLLPGDIFGELALAGDMEHETTAITLEDTFVCQIRKKDFEDFISNTPHFSLKIVKWMSLRLKRIENRFENMIFQDVRTRLMTLLHDLAQKYGIRVKEGNKLPFRLSHQEIANLIGSTRETVTLELNTLKKNGDIIVQGKDLILPIKNPSSLS